jgi:transcriptional regulator with XRE-family HTH domain
MEELVVVSEPHGSFGAFLRACRHRASLSQEQLAARAEVSERTVRNLEAGRVRSPRTDTVRLLADALQLSGPERGSWFEAARGVNHQRAGPAAPEANGPMHLPGDAPIRTWAGRAGPDAGAHNDGQLACADRRELAELRRENRKLREDTEILKRAAAIFAAATR